MTVDLTKLVKPLVWLEGYYAPNRFGTYSIVERYDENDVVRYNWVFSISWAEESDEQFFTLAAAQAAAQADYAARIIAALDGDAIARIRADALREAAKACEEWGAWNDTAQDIADAILALIDKEASHDRT